MSQEEFWRQQYIDHCDFIASGTCDSHIIARAKEFKLLWEAEDWNDDLLEEFYDFKQKIYQAILNKELDSWLHPSVYEDMISEVEYMLKKDRTNEDVLLFWLNNIEGHLAITGSWLDPAEITFRERSDALCKTLSVLKQELGLPKNWNGANLMSRKQTGEPKKSLIIGDYPTVVKKVKELQLGITDFFLILQRLLLQADVFGVLTPLFIEHTIRECKRAELELEEL